jgi:peptide/nickel transport system substrate-binding protein
LVKDGKLPPVDARLPKKPAVFKGQEGIGKYGGTWRRAFNGVSDRWGPTKLGDRTWAWFTKDLNILPRVAESWQVSPDGKEWTFKLREGMKWSDGTEMTSEDIAWWYKNELRTRRCTPACLRILGARIRALSSWIRRTSTRRSSPSRAPAHSSFTR